MMKGFEAIITFFGDHGWHVEKRIFEASDGYRLSFYKKSISGGEYKIGINIDDNGAMEVHCVRRRNIDRATVIFNGELADPECFERLGETLKNYE